MAIVADKLETVIQLQYAKYLRDINTAQQQTNQSLAQIERRFSQTNAHVSRSIGSMGAALGGLGAYLSVQRVREYADSWNQVTRSLTAGEQIFGVRLRSASALNKMANEARIDNDAFAKLYIRTAAATRELGVAEADVAQVTQTVAMALKLGSASASEQTSTMLQLSQALQKGKLDGDEFRTVMENAGIIQELLADKLKVSKGEIVRMAAEGRLSVDLFFSALVDGGEKVRRVFLEMPATIEESFLVLNNNVEEYIGGLDKAYGTTEAMVAAVKALSQNIEPIGDGAIVAASALLAAFSPQIVKNVAAVALGVAAAAGPFGLIAGSLAGGVVAADLFGDKMLFNVDLMRGAIAQGADFGTAWGQAFSDVDKQGVTLQDTMRALVVTLAEDVSSGIQAVMAALPENTLGVMRKVVNGLIGTIVFSVDAVTAVVSTLPQVVASKFIDGINAVIRGVQAMIDAVAEGINKVIAGINRIPGAEVGYIVAPDLGQIENQYAGAGERAGKAFADAASQLTRDWVGEATGAAMASLDSVLDRASARAREFAAERRRRDMEEWETKTIPAKPVYGTGATGTDKAAEKARRAFERDLLQAENRIEMARLEADMIGRSAFEVEKMRTKQALLNEARKAGVALTADDLLKIEAISEATARAVTEAEALRAAYQDVSDTTKTFLSDFARGLKEGRSATELLADGLDRIADKLIDMGVNNLVEMALGGLTGRGGNAQGTGLGGALMSLLGFAEGGRVRGPGTGTSDSIVARLSDGEYVVKERAARKYGPLLDAINNDRLPKFANGGPVGVPSIPAVPQAAPAAAATSMQITVAPVFHVENGTPEGVDKLKNEMVPVMRNIARTEFAAAFDRTDGLRRMKGG